VEALKSFRVGVIIKISSNQPRPVQQLASDLKILVVRLAIYSSLGNGGNLIK
jgi:hypothetical protein